MNALLEKPPLPLFLHGEEPDEDDGQFKIDDEAKAAWAAGKILAARRRIASRQLLAKAYEDRILDWLTRANASDESSIGFLEGSLRPWVEIAVANAGRSRSIKLPGAKVGLRKSPNKVEVLNAELALKYCEKHAPVAVVTKKDLAKSELKALLAAGKAIPGTFLSTGNDELIVSED